MAAMRRNQSKPTSTSTLVMTVALGALLGGASLMGCGEEEVPVRPTYSRDIAPLMEAHCIRCHGAGGTLNADPDIPANAKFTGPPTNGDFTSLNDNGNVNGLLHYTGAGIAILKLYVDSGPMPLPPANPLTDREHDLLMTWAANPLP